ncbi:DUF2793 domain-containing protein [uncultured Thioclava sp.]|uniref:DUF2793 domain-containing protein n=1 Tax=uncultured Thioclava sp. TaxID=473858 RepID=UPI0025E1C3BD|nr:DUF2793 domain-containing protein [uncultured Thioclava sp.]
MSDSSVRLDLPFMLPSQAQKHVTYNEALQRLDVLTQLVLEGRGATIPPAVPQAGQIHALAPIPQGDWAGKGGMLAQWTGFEWLFIAPQEGWQAWDLSTAMQCIFVDGAWQEIATTLQSLDGLGIGTDWDATNRLAVASEASLFTHAGAGHQLKLNKASETDTASLLYQSDFTGHAEMGLTGDNDFLIKVSDDGSTWTEALRVDTQSGQLSGAAVQSSAVDKTLGRLMTVGAFGLGETETAPVLSDLDATDIASGLYTWSTSGTGTPPLAVSLYVKVTRFNSSFFIEEVSRPFLGKSWVREWRGSAWTAWVEIYSNLSILGTVSQSGGVPKGALIERGSNANGTYVRFADGTQMCWKDNTALTTAPAVFVGTITKIDGNKLWIGRWF